MRDTLSMAKAELKLPSGANVQIEGTPEEVKFLLSSFAPADSGQGSNHGQKKNINSKKKDSKKIKKDGPMGLIKELVEENYFKGQKRSISDIQKKLEERGHIYAQTSLSPTLMRLVRSRNLRRIKEKKGWAYVS
jgi:hypothetical protein